MAYHSVPGSRWSTQTIVPSLNCVTTAADVLGPSRTIPAGTSTRKSVQGGIAVAVGRGVTHRGRQARDALGGRRSDHFGALSRFDHA